MKNTDLKESAIFIIAALILSTLLISCSSDKSKSIVFKAERMYYNAVKRLNKAFIKPDLTDRTIQSQIKDAFYETNEYCWNFIDSLPEEAFPEEHDDLVNVAFLSVSQLAKIFLAEKKYDSAIYVLNQLLTFAQPSGEILLTTQANLARTHLQKGNVNETMNIYRSIIDTFFPPVDNNGDIIETVINLPLRIIEIYHTINDDEKASEAAASAIEYYQRLITEWPNSAMEAAARTNMARVYYDDGKWDEAIASLSQIKDSTGQTDIEAAMMAANILLDGKKDYETAIKHYDRLQKRVVDTAKTPVILMKKGIAFFEKGDFQSCHRIMRQINDDFPEFFQENPLPQKYIALSLEAMGNWDRAETELQWLIDHYSTTEPAFDAFLIIAEHYKTVGNKEIMNSWFRRGENFYFQMAARYKNTNVEASAMSYTAEIARREGNWQKAVKQLEQLYNRFPLTDVGKKSLVTAASVYREKLNNPEKADSLLERFRTEPIPLPNGKINDIMSDDKI